MVFERVFLLIVHWQYSNIKRQKPRSPDLIGARMSENTISCDQDPLCYNLFVG